VDITGFSTIETALLFDVWQKEKASPACAAFPTALALMGIDSAGTFVLTSPARFTGDRGQGGRGLFCAEVGQGRRGRVSTASGTAGTGTGTGT